MPGQAGGGSFQKEKNYITQKELPIECAQGDRPAWCPNHFFAVNEPSAVPWWWCFVLWSEVFWCLDVCCGVRSCDGHVIWCDVMACVVSCHVMQCDVMVMSCTTPELLCATKCYYKYYSVLQSTTPVLPCTTKYYSSTTKYYSSTTPVLSCTTKYYSVLQKYYSSITLYYKVLLKYYSVLLQYYPILQSTSWLIRITYETSFTMRRATKGSFQLQQIVRLLRKVNLMIDPHRIWNVIYNAQSNSQHPPTSPNIAPATQNESHDWSTSHMKRHLQCAEQQSTPSNLTKYCACHAKWISLIRITYETSFTMRGVIGSTLQPHQILRLPRKRSVMIGRITYETSFTRRGATGINLQPHQILRLPRKMNLMIDPHHIWNVIYNARSNRHQPPTSPNTAPAAQKECHDWSASHMKRHLQCAEQQASTSNLTKYCACHAKWPPNISQKLAENRWNVISNARPIRPWSETDPTMIRPRKRKPQPAAPQRLLFVLARSRFYWKLQRFPLRLSFQISPHAAPATKSDTWTSPNAAPATKSDTWTSPNAAPATKSDTWTSPNAAPATKKWHMNFTKCCTCHKKWHMNITKCCTCHKKWNMNVTKCCTYDLWLLLRLLRLRLRLRLLLLLGLLLLGLLLLLLVLGLLLLGLLLLGLLLLRLLLLQLLLLLGRLLLLLLLLGLLLLGLLLLGLLLLGLLLLRLLLLGLLLLGLLLLLLLLGLLLLGLLLLGLLLLRLLLLGLLLLGLLLLLLLLLGLLLLGLLLLDYYY